MNPPKRIAAIVLPALACEIALLQHAVATTTPSAKPNQSPPTAKPPNAALQPNQPFGIILDEDAQQQHRPIVGQDRLAAVDPRAYNYGIRPGQCVSEAGAFIGNLQIVRLKRSQLCTELSFIAEVALQYGTTAALTLQQPRQRKRTKLPHKRAPIVGYPLGAGAGPMDTVWLDISGCAHLHGGEQNLVAELYARITALGHRVRIAVAAGPRIAQAVARWCPSPSTSTLLVAPGQGARRLASLPTAALPLQSQQLTWLSKLGILRIADLNRLDRARLAHRLGPSAQDMMQLLAGHDAALLCAYTPPKDISEHAHFDEAISSSEPLLFVLRGLLAHAIKRLDLRGQACQAISLWLRYDPAVIALRKRANNKFTLSNCLTRKSQVCHDGKRTPRTGQANNLEPTYTLRVNMPVPLSREADLDRTLRAKLEKLTVSAPIIEVQLTLERLTERPCYQVELGQRGEPEAAALPMLLAELSAWLGPHNVGTLTQHSTHCPETRSQLVPITHSPTPTAPSPRCLAWMHSWHLPEPTRMLPQPVAVTSLCSGGSLASSANLYSIERLSLLGRIDMAHWWTEQPICRDYARGLLRTRTQQVPPLGSQLRIAARPHHLSHGSSASRYEMAEAWVYIDRNDGQGYLQGWFD